MSAAPCVISVADHAGWAHVLSVAALASVPAVVDRRRVTTIEAGLPSMPYHHESIGMSVDEADRLIARVRKSIAEHTARALRDVVADLASECRVVAMAIREPLFRGLPDTVATVRRSYQVQCAADGMMYQIALCDVARDLSLEVHRCRRGEETAIAAKRLGVSTTDVESFVRGTGRPSGPPWTEEHRRAYAAGIAALASHPCNIRLPQRRVR